MKKLRTAGVLFLGLSAFFSLSNLSITGAVIGTKFASFSFIALAAFIFGAAFIFASNLEERARVGWKSRLAGAAIVGAAGAAGGHYAEKSLRETVRGAERTIQIGQVIGKNLIVGSKEFYDAGRKKYVEASGEHGKLYLEQRKQQSDDYLKNLERALVTSIDSAGPAGTKMMESTEPTRGIQELKKRIYTGAGKLMGSNGIDKRNDSQYTGNYNQLAKRRLNALIKLMKLNNDIDYTTRQLALKAAKPEDNKDVVNYLGSLSQEASDIYRFLDSAETLSVNEIYEGEGNKNYTKIRDMGDKIVEAGYPISDAMKLGLPLALGAVGAYAGSRRRPAKAIAKTLHYTRAGSEKVISGIGRAAPYAAKYTARTINAARRAGKRFRRR